MVRLTQKAHLAWLRMWPLNLLYALLLIRGLVINGRNRSKQESAVRFPVFLF